MASRRRRPRRGRFVAGEPFGGGVAGCEDACVVVVPQGAAASGRSGVVEGRLVWPAAVSRAAMMVVMVRVERG